MAARPRRGVVAVSVGAWIVGVGVGSARRLAAAAAPASSTTRISAATAHSRTSRGRRPSRSRRAGARRIAARRRTPPYDPSPCTPRGRHRSRGTRRADATGRARRARARARAGSSGTRTTRRVRVHGPAAPRVAALVRSSTVTVRDESAGVVALEARADEPLVPRPAPARVGGRVDPDEAAAAPDVALEARRCSPPARSGSRSSRGRPRPS